MDQFKDELSKIVECVICLDQLTDPKELPCHHSFCRECLDDILQFKKDGSASIKCPLRCTNETLIAKDKTTRDLGSDFRLKDILVMFEKEAARSDVSKKISLCNAKEGCRNSIVIRCPSCNITMCENCRQKHDTEHKSHNSVPITFNKKEGKLKVVCNDHAVTAKYICCGDKFICEYCRNRKHIAHTPYSLELKVKEIKDLLTTHVHKVEKVKDLIKKNLPAVEAAITDCRKLFYKSLAKHKLVLLLTLSAFLNEEENQLKEQYETLTLNHLKKYTVTDPTEHLKSTEQASDENILLEREAIVKSTSEWNTSTIPTTFISFAGPDGNGANALGILNVYAGEDVDIMETTTNSNFSYDIFQPDANTMSPSSIKDLKRLLKEGGINLTDEEIPGNELSRTHDQCETFRNSWEKKNTDNQYVWINLETVELERKLSEMTTELAAAKKTIEEGKRSTKRSTKEVEVTQLRDQPDSQVEEVQLLRMNDLERRVGELTAELATAKNTIEEDNEKRSNKEVEATQLRDKIDSQVEELQILRMNLDIYKSDFQIERESREKQQLRLMEQRELTEQLALENRCLKEQIQQTDKGKSSKTQQQEENAGKVPNLYAVYEDVKINTLKKQINNNYKPPILTAEDYMCPKCEITLPDIFSLQIHVNGCLDK